MHVSCCSYSRILSQSFHTLQVQVQVASANLFAWIVFLLSQRVRISWEQTRASCEISAPFFEFFRRAKTNDRRLDPHTLHSEQTSCILIADKAARNEPSGNMSKTAQTWRAKSIEKFNLLPVPDEWKDAVAFGTKYTWKRYYSHRTKMEKDSGSIQPTTMITVFQKRNRGTIVTVIETI